MNARIVSCDIRGSRRYTHLDVSASALGAPYLAIGHRWTEPARSYLEDPNAPLGLRTPPDVPRNSSPVIMAAHLEKSSPVDDSYIDAGSFGVTYGIHDCFPADPVELLQNHRP